MRGSLMHIELGGARSDGRPVVENIESWGQGCGTDVAVGPDGFLYISHAGWGESEGTIRRVRPGTLEPDWPIGNGHFFTQMAADSNREGYAVTDDDDARFHSEFERLGGVESFGFPVSNRYTRDGEWYQAFGISVVKWNSALGFAEFANILDDLAAAGFDDRLLDEFNVPVSRDWDEDAGGLFVEVIRNHLWLLDESSSIKREFLRNEGWLQQYGLPMSFGRVGDLVVLRSQRAVFYFNTSSIDGKVEVVWGSELAKDLGFIPAGALWRHP
jgi:hypothetical protein